MTAQPFDAEYGVYWVSDGEADQFIPDIVSTNRGPHAWFPTFLIAVVGDDSGGEYCFDTRHADERGEFPIVLLDPEIHDENSLDFEPVAKDLGEFLLGATGRWDPRLTSPLRRTPRRRKGSYGASKDTPPSNLGVSMVMKIRYRLALAIVIAVILLSLGKMAIRTPTTGPPAEVARPGVIPDVAPPENTLLIRQYPEEGQPRGRDGAVRVRLDVNRLRAYGLTQEDVMVAMKPSTVAGPRNRADPPPGVVYVTRLGRPDQYEDIILKANAEGDVVRLKDVGKVEVGR